MIDPNYHHEQYLDPAGLQWADGLDAEAAAEAAEDAKAEEVWRQAEHQYIVECEAVPYDWNDNNEDSEDAKAEEDMINSDLDEYAAFLERVLDPALVLPEGEDSPLLFRQECRRLARRYVQRQRKSHRQGERGRG